MDENRDKVDAGANAGVDEVAAMGGVDADSNANPEKALVVEGAVLEVTAGGAETARVEPDAVDDDGNEDPNKETEMEDAAAEAEDCEETCGAEVVALAIGAAVVVVGSAGVVEKDGAELDPNKGDKGLVEGTDEDALPNPNAGGCEEAGAACVPDPLPKEGKMAGEEDATDDDGEEAVGAGVGVAEDVVALAAEVAALENNEVVANENEGGEEEENGEDVDEVVTGAAAEELE